MKTKLLIILSLTFAVNVQAGSATWSLNPTSSDWNTAANWTPSTIPNSTQAVATFATSSLPNVAITGKRDTVDHMAFAANASPYAIAVGPGLNSNLFLAGTGIINDSVVTQNFTISGDTASISSGLIQFENDAIAGENIAFTNKGGPSFQHPGGQIFFSNNSSAGSVTFVNQADLGGGAEIRFFDSSTAAAGNFTNNGGQAFSSGGSVNFFGQSTAGDATFVCAGGLVEFGGSGTVSFVDGTSAGTAEFTLLPGGSHSSGGFVTFDINSTADHATITAEGADSSQVILGNVQFYGTASAGEALITLEGGANHGPGGNLKFFFNSSAGNCIAIAMNGSGQDTGASINFLQDSLGGTARLELLGPGAGSGMLLIDEHNAPGLSVGSIEGGGLIGLGHNNLTVGANDVTTTFSGTIFDDETGSGGSLTKIGTGTLTLSGANTYTGGTTISVGALLVANTIGSATGTGTTAVNAGTFGGSGIVSGAVTVGAGSGAGAFLAPAFGNNKQVTLSLQGSLTLQSDATYTYTFKARTSQARADLVIAKGVTINGATIKLKGKTKGTLTAGTILTVISNTSANPISGTFSNLADGAIVTVNGNNLQASYTGGDGNDLTLTVLP